MTTTRNHMPTECDPLHYVHADPHTCGLHDRDDEDEAAEVLDVAQITRTVARLSDANLLKELSFADGFDLRDARGQAWQAALVSEIERRNRSAKEGA